MWLQAKVQAVIAQASSSRIPWHTYIFTNAPDLSGVISCPKRARSDTISRDEIVRRKTSSNKMPWYVLLCFTRRHFAYAQEPFLGLRDTRYLCYNSRIPTIELDFSQERLKMRERKRERGKGKARRVSRKSPLANVISSTFYWREADFKALSHLDLIAQPTLYSRTF